jgi:hypothetical protein
MPVQEMLFVVTDVVAVSRDLAAHPTPDFPGAGQMVILEPPCEVGDHELAFYKAAISLPSGETLTTSYDYWHRKPGNVLTLFFCEGRAVSIARGSRVRFVKR